jgi:hypothetical protein
MMPFGGYKRSGIGRENEGHSGVSADKECLDQHGPRDARSICHALTAPEIAWHARGAATKGRAGAPFQRFSDDPPDSARTKQIRQSHPEMNEVPSPQ